MHKITNDKSQKSNKSQTPNFNDRNKRLKFDDCFLDFVIIELKAAENLCEEHEAQLINYLKATKMEVGLLLNFGKKAEFKRKIFTNDRK